MKIDTNMSPPELMAMGHGLQKMAKAKADKPFPKENAAERAVLGMFGAHFDTFVDSILDATAKERLI